MDQCELINKICEDIRVEFSYGFIECLLTDSLFESIY